VSLASPDIAKRVPWSSTSPPCFRPASWRRPKLTPSSQTASPGAPRAGAHVFVYDAETSTVLRRQVRLGGVRGDQMLVIDGLEAGDRVASAGVSFLFEGMEVTLLED